MTSDKSHCPKTNVPKNSPIFQSCIEGIFIGNKGRKGIFVSKRNIDSFTEITEYIMQNYYSIQKDIEKNKFPLEKDMFKQISSVINR